MKVVEEYTLDKPTKYKIGDVVNTKVESVKEEGIVNEVSVTFTIIEVTNNKCVVVAETDVDDIVLLNFATFNFYPYE